MLLKLFLKIEFVLHSVWRKGWVDIYSSNIFIQFQINYVAKKKNEQMQLTPQI